MRGRRSWRRPPARPRCPRRSSARWSRRWWGSRPGPRGACSPTWCGRAAGCSPRSRRTGDERGIAPSLEELVTAACRAATDLADLDENLGRFERQRERFAAAAPERLDALTRSERTRDALVQRLLEAMTAVARLRTQQAELAQASDPTLGELASELRREAEAQAAATRGAGGVSEELARRLRRLSMTHAPPRFLSPTCHSTRTLDLPSATNCTPCTGVCQAPFPRGVAPVLGHPGIHARGMRPLAYLLPLPFRTPLTHRPHQYHSPGSGRASMRVLAAQLRVSALRQRGGSHDRGARRRPRDARRDGRCRRRRRSCVLRSQTVLGRRSRVGGHAHGPPRREPAARGARGGGPRGDGLSLGRDAGGAPPARA